MLLKFKSLILVPVALSQNINSSELELWVDKRIGTGIGIETLGIGISVMI